MTDETKKTNPPEEAVAPADRTDTGSRSTGEGVEPGAETPKGETPSPAEGKEKEKEGGPEIPEVLPLLPVRDIVIFPYMTLPLFVG
ncbi:MAG TPA: hypothetical protein VIJ89_01480, partial [Deferrimonas sp.]